MINIIMYYIKPVNLYNYYDFIILLYYLLITNVEMMVLQEELEKLRKELMEKQVLLNQAARAFKLYEEQKAATSRTQDQYQQSLEKEREKVTKLERGKRKLVLSAE